MEIETLRSMNEGIYDSLMMMIEIVMLITVLFTIAGLTTYLAGIAWHCYTEKRRSKTSPQPTRHASSPHRLQPAPPIPGHLRQSLTLQNISTAATRTNSSSRVKTTT